MQRTLAVLGGIWERLDYFRQLRGPEGTYEHWGLVHVHGHDAANQAIAEVHSQLYLELLRAPLPQLLQQLELSAKNLNCPAGEIAERLQDDWQRIIPVNLLGGAPEHLKSVLTSMSLLTKARR